MLIPANRGRELLLADRTYYVRTDGNDGNSGLANTVAGAFATLQRAYDVASRMLDLGGCDVTVQIADGVYTAGISAARPLVGSGRIIFAGNAATPGNVVVAAAGNCFDVSDGAAVTVQAMELRSTGANLLSVDRGGRINFSNLRFGAAAIHQINAQDNGVVVADGNYAIVGAAITHWTTVGGGIIRARAVTVTLSGAPAFGVAFAYLVGGFQYVDANTFTGAATGVRYNANAGGAIYTSGAGAAYLPGSAAGGTASGGQYA